MKQDLLEITALWAPKLSYFDGRAPQLMALIIHGTPAAGVIGHIPIRLSVYSVYLAQRVCLFCLSDTKCLSILSIWYKGSVYSVYLAQRVCLFCLSGTKGLSILSI